MWPVILEIGPIKLYSFGLMCALALLLGSRILTLEMARRGMGASAASNYAIAALVGGFAGAKLNFLVLHPDVFQEGILKSIFSGAGLVWYGGFAGGVLACFLLSRKYHHPFGDLSDAFALPLVTAYTLGRFGCFFSGDGDYGPPSDLPWAMAFPKGIVPTDVPVHPTPIYEILMMSVVFAILWKLRNERWARWRRFGLYLILAGLERFIAEIWRTNPPVALGLSQAQIVSVLLFSVGMSLFLRRPERGTAAGLDPKKTRTATR